MYQHQKKKVVQSVHAITRQVLIAIGKPPTGGNIITTVHFIHITVYHGRGGYYLHIIEKQL